MQSASQLLGNSENATLGNDNLLSVVEALLGPIAVVSALWAVAFYYEGELLPAYLILSVIVFALMFPGRNRLQASFVATVVDIGINWLWIGGLLVLTAYATNYHREFSRHALTTWLWFAPVMEVTATLVFRACAPFLLSLQGPPVRTVIVGMNEQGLALARRIQSTRWSRIELCGFLESRNPTRIASDAKFTVLGSISDIAELVRQHRIQVIYMSLPMASQPRILSVLDHLKDTTTSIYFVPDMFVTDLIQGQTREVCGMPVISVCETPFVGYNGALKRGSDIVFSLLILLLIFPVLLLVAVAVKLTSPGPIIFKQRRYGLDGQEILVYKFRSMTVTEDGSSVKQATKNDNRITPLGAILRKTSLDELPQFINVLQGRMSIVGPRPHAVAHNEMYRKLIKGYMVRHKVKPGITGWAQVNGYRGETDTLDKMQGRIDYDLDYLRNWSLQLDVHIILKTVRLVAKDQQAY
jgi:putative colanic acid biosynthesis UDP-glucose lipid carrier transferase